MPFHLDIFDNYNLTHSNLPFHLMKYWVLPFTIFLSKIFSTSYVSPSLPLPSDIFGVSGDSLKCIYMLTLWCELSKSLSVYSSFFMLIQHARLLWGCRPRTGSQTMLERSDWSTQVECLALIGSHNVAALAPIGFSPRTSLPEQRRHFLIQTQIN